MDNKDVSLEQLHLEKMRYTNNSLSYKLGLIGIVLSVAVCFISLNSLSPSSILTLVIVLINILVFLLGFLSAEKVKTYSKNYSYMMYGLGGVCIARIFIYPLMLIVNYAKFSHFIKTEPGSVADVYSAASQKYSKVLGATIIGKLNDTQDAIVQTGYLWNNGIFRGVLLIVMLLIAAACFISSGVICYIKQKKLNAYLQSINK